MNLPTTRSELLASGATRIAEVSSAAPGKETWTQLSLWWIADEDRPYIAVAEGLTSRAALEDRFRAKTFGSISPAIAWFDASDLRDKLNAELPADLADIFPDGSELRRRRVKASRGWKGSDSIVDALGWLYDDEPDEGVTVRAKRVERDFGVPWRTVTNALNGENVRGWGAGFVAALRFFDRGAWRAARRAIEPGRTHDETSAIDDNLDFPAPYGRHADGRPREVTECD